ncbi:MAG: bifunctional folylpolyglutamate synthase/dihydrofolate synthase [Ignavibacteria bacterium]|nr:bifunctional folylpolyglutamate synthase/dihydrofolate synthase [Ignavibacteria bacterium]
MAKDKFVSYSHSIEYLFNLERRGIKYDLRNIRSLLTILDNPERAYKTIHVAGTNGKGSVSSIIYSYLIESGIRAGLNTSPHISDFRERIVCGRRKITRSFILGFVNRMYEHIEKIKPSFFEATTAMAFDYFRHCGIEAAVIETGLGGRLDSTNVVDPVVSVITGIAVDHVYYLGNTIEGIAGEKAGIIKKGKPVVIGKLPNEARKVILEKAIKEGSEFKDSWKNVSGKILERSDRGFKFSLGENKVKYTFPEIGDFQLINIKTAYSVLKIFCEKQGVPFESEIFIRSLKNISRNSQLHGRFELVSRNPKIVIDVSHNLEAIKNLKKNLEYFRYKKLYVILGMMHDKDYCSCIKEIGKLDCRIILTRPKYSRAADPAVMMNCVKVNKQKFSVYMDLKEAVDSVLGEIGKNDMLVVTGSFFLAGEFLDLKSVKKMLTK